MKTSNIGPNYEVLLSTKSFLNQYLSQKNKGIEGGIYLSIYLDEEDPTSTSRLSRLNKILRETELSLKSQLNTNLANKILSKLKNLNLHEVIKTNKFSIAIFISENFAGFVFVPFKVHENVVVARSLHLKPILNWIKIEDQFYLITMSSKLCRLLKGDSFSLTEIASVVSSSSDLEKLKKTSDKNLKNKIISMAEEKFYPHMKNDDYPIILGGVAELHDIYVSINRDPDLLNERIIGNLDRSSFEELHTEGLKILSDKNFEETQEIVAKFSELRPYGKVIEDLNQITIAAIQGRIRNLMIPKDKFIWGHLDKTTGQISCHINKNLAIPEDDVLDDLAEIVIARGGGVTLMNYQEMPTDSDAIALLK